MLKLMKMLQNHLLKKLAKVENIEFVNSKVENSITDVSNNLRGLYSNK